MCWLLLILAAAHCAATEPPTQRKVLILGDSLSAAYGMALEQGWVALVSEQLRQSHPQVQLINASISGETSGGGLSRLPQLLQQHRPELVFIELGANDGLRGYPPASLNNNLTQMTRLAAASGARSILVEIKIPANYGHRYIKAISDTYHQVAKNTDSMLVPFLALDIQKDPQLLQSDGLHPTAKAQPLIAAHFLPTLQRALNANK